MVITSWPFAAFVLAVLALYYLLPRRPQIWLMLLASYVLYGTWSLWFPVALAALTAANFLVGRRLWAGGGKPWLWTGIGLNILALGMLKYAGFFLPQALGALGLGSQETAAQILKLLLPIGFSYRVLENIAFLVDASRRQLPQFPGLIDFALFLAWFPKLVSGPIERGKAFLTQLPQGRVIDNDALSRGFSLIVVGLARKILIADLIRGRIPQGLFDQTLTQGGGHLLLWLIADVFVVYNDFAGYTDMARGISTLFGVDLTRNFSAPFFSRNFSELWLRWHMSLSFWLRDYIYLPLSRALLRRTTRPNTLINLLLPPLAAMLVSALWHEAAWHMLAWGLLWGIFLTLGRLPMLWQRPVIPPDRRPVWRQGLGMGGVLAMLAVSNVLFRCDVAGALKVLQLVFQRGNWTAPMTTALFLIALSLATDWFQHRSGDEAVFRRWPLWARSLVLGVLILALFLATRGKVAAPFIYQAF